MDCEKIRPLLSEYLDAGLSEEETLLVRAHLSQCSQCAIRLSLMQNLTKALREEEVEAPPGLASSIMNTIHKPKKRMIFAARPFTSAAVVVLLAFVAWQAMSNGALLPGQNRILSTADSSQKESAASIESQNNAMDMDRPKMSAGIMSVPEETEKADEEDSGENLKGFFSKSYREIDDTPEAFAMRGSGDAPTEGAGNITYSVKTPEIPFSRAFALLAVVSGGKAAPDNLTKGLEELGSGYYLADEAQWQALLEGAGRGELSLEVFQLTSNFSDGVLLTFE